jgi:hypothetical protein
MQCPDCGYEIIVPEGGMFGCPLTCRLHMTPIQIENSHQNRVAALCAQRETATTGRDEQSVNTRRVGH